MAATSSNQTISKKITQSKHYMRVITFSRFFPAKHPKAGDPTCFVEKIYSAVGVGGDYLHIPIPEVDNFLYKHDENFFDPKWHTIRAGKRWKVGDKFSARVWSGKPYASKQIEFAQIEIKKVFDFEMDPCGVFSINGYYFPSKDIDYLTSDQLMEFIESEDERLANNDGLSAYDFHQWFKCHPKKKDEGFSGQILCWSENIEY